LVDEPPYIALEKLLLAYAIIEGVIDVFALKFHNIFVAATSYRTAQCECHG
jgi:hypothetical protein